MQVYNHVKLSVHRTKINSCMEGHTKLKAYPGSV